MMTADDLSNALYQASLRGLTLWPEAVEGGGNSYAVCEGDRVLASGECMESALEQWCARRDTGHRMEPKG